MRLVLTLFFGIVFAAWADAQQTAGSLTAAERRKQLQSNRKLLEKLVSNSVALSGANSSLDRAVAACRGAMGDLCLALDGAITSHDASRVAELGDYLAAIVHDGLLPNLNEAKLQFADGSPERVRLVDLHKSASDDFARVESSIPLTDSLARSQQVKAVMAKWQVATQNELAEVLSK